MYPEEQPYKATQLVAAERQASEFSLSQSGSLP